MRSDQMKFTDGLQIASGILAAFGIAAGSLVLGLFVGPYVVAIPFLVMIGLGFVAWMQRRKISSPFLTGLLIGVCASLLLCATCDIWIFSR